MLYTIRETADRTGVSAHTLRYYERIGLLDPIERSGSGHRRYDDDDIGRIKFLTLLRQTGMPIRRMQDFVNFTRDGGGTLPQRIELLEQHLADIAAQLQNLKACEVAVRDKLCIYRALQLDSGERAISTPDDRFIVLRQHGPRWDHSRPMRGQRHWDAHAAFMNALADEGFVIEGGPLGDEERILLVISARTGDAVRDRLAVDPWEQQGILVSQPARRWTVLLGAPAKA